MRPATRAVRLAAVWIAAVGICRTVGADDLGGEGFLVPATSSWNEARKALLVQVRAVDDPYASDALFRQDVPHTRTVLLLDPEGDSGEPHDVTLAEAARWGQPPEVLFRAGIENLHRRFPPNLRTTPELRRGVKVNLLYGEHPYAAGYALAVTDHSQCMGKKGSLVAIPSRHALLCFPIRSSRAFHGYLALVNMAVDIQHHGDAPIVPHVYWFHRGTWETQRVVLDGKRFSSERTPGFEELLKKLPRDIKDPRARRW